MLSWEVSAFKISWLQSYPNLTSLAWLSCFSQNSNAYNFSSNETEYDPETTHYQLLSILLLVADVFNNFFFSKLQGGHL